MGAFRPQTLREEMQRYVRYELSRGAHEQGQETFEEFDDFEVEDDEPDMTSAYVMTDAQAEYVEGADDYALEAREGPPPPVEVPAPSPPVDPSENAEGGTPTSPGPGGV